MTTSTRLEAFNEARTALDKARRESERLRTEAIQELLQARQQVDRDLRLLGFGAPNHLDRSIVDGPVEEPKRRTRQQRAKAHCPFCNIDGHDGRAHRGQGDNKRKFTTAELHARGFAIPPRPERISDELHSALAEFQERR